MSALGENLFSPEATSLNHDSTNFELRESVSIVALNPNSKNRLSTQSALSRPIRRALLRQLLTDAVDKVGGATGLVPSLLRV